MSSAGRQTEKRAQIEAAVLEATEALLAEGASFAELGIERIATRAGISRTAFYFYFKDKRELLVRLTEDVNAQLVSAASTWWSGEGELRVALRAIACSADRRSASPDHHVSAAAISSALTSSVSRTSSSRLSRK